MLLCGAAKGARFSDNWGAHLKGLFAPPRRI